MPFTASRSAARRASGRVLPARRLGRGVEQSPLGCIARQTPGPMKHRQGLIGIGMHPHCHLHIMVSMPVLGNLETAPLIPHGVIVGHHPLLLHTEDLGEVRATPGHEGRARLRRRHGKPLVVDRNEPVAEELIRRRHVRDAGQRQFFRQPVLQRAEGPFGSATGFRRMGGKQRDPQLL